MIDVAFDSNDMDELDICSMKLEKFRQKLSRILHWQCKLLEMIPLTFEELNFCWMHVKLLRRVQTRIMPLRAYKSQKTRQTSAATTLFTYYFRPYPITPSCVTIVVVCSVRFILAFHIYGILKWYEKGQPNESTFSMIWHNKYGSVYEKNRYEMTNNFGVEKCHNASSLFFPANIRYQSKCII